MNDNDSLISLGLAGADLISKKLVGYGNKNLGTPYGLLLAITRTIPLRPWFFDLSNASKSYEICFL